MSWTTAPSWSAGQVAGVSSGLTILSDDINILGAAWMTYTPGTATGITQGNGTLTTKYLQFGQTVIFVVQFTLGSTSAVTGSPTFSLPVTAARSNWRANGLAFDSSASAYYNLAAIGTTTTTVGFRADPTTAGNNMTTLSSSVPFTWAAGDVLTANGIYEAA